MYFAAGGGAAERDGSDEEAMLLEDDGGGELVARAADELSASSSEESASKRSSRLTLRLELVPLVWPLVVEDWESASCSVVSEGASGRGMSLSWGGDEAGGDSG